LTISQNARRARSYDVRAPASAFSSSPVTPRRVAQC
jgi:hypothetical protein